jgi:maleate isomerase
MSFDRKRIGLVVPSSNITVEREVPELLRAHEKGTGAQADRPVPASRFSFHSSRVGMTHVSAAELAAMNTGGAAATRLLADAACDVVIYACLVAVMSQGPGAHERIEAELEEVLASSGHPAPVISAAGALVRTLKRGGYERVAILTPYVPSLTDAVAGYLETSGVVVTSVTSLGVADNLAVGCLDPSALPDLVESRLDLSAADALVLSACVQMPSLPAVQQVEDRFGLPVVTATTAVVSETLAALGEPPMVAGAGRLLYSANNEDGAR